MLLLFSPLNFTTKWHRIFNHIVIIYYILFTITVTCGAAEATSMGFVCFVVINPRVLSANIIDLSFFVSYIFLFHPPGKIQIVKRFNECGDTCAPCLDK